MTLNTHIYILGKFDGADLHSWVCANLLKVDVQKVAVTTRIEGEPYVDFWDKKEKIATESRIDNDPGQGFDAWFDVYWTEEPHEYDEGLENAEGVHEDDVEYALNVRKALGAPYYGAVSFDTSYGFNRNGMGCTELHGTYIVRLYREYFEPRGIDIVWQNEYQGTFHKNLDEEGMRRFLGAGDEAMDWFFNTVSPIIQAEVAAEGGTIQFGG